jgi:IS5 family transposase
LVNPVTLHLSPGQDPEVSHAETLLGDDRPEAVLRDKGYDSDKLAAAIAARGAEVAILPKKNRVDPRDYDQGDAGGR